MGRGNGRLNDGRSNEVSTSVAPVISHSGKKTLSKDQIARMQKGRIGSETVMQKTGLIFPPQRFLKLLKKGEYAKKINRSCGVFMAGGLEMVIGEIIAAMAHVAQNSKSKMMQPKHVAAALSEDEELSRVFSNAIIIRGGLSHSAYSGAGSNAAAAGRKKAERVQVNSHLSTAENSDADEPMEDDELMDEEDEDEEEEEEEAAEEPEEQEEPEPQPKPSRAEGKRKKNR